MRARMRRCQAAPRGSLWPLNDYDLAAERGWGGEVRKVGQRPFCRSVLLSRRRQRAMATPRHRGRKTDAHSGRTLNRREFLKLAGAGAVAATVGSRSQQWTNTVYAAMGPRKNLVVG